MIKIEATTATKGSPPKMSFIILAKQMMELMMPHLSDSDKLEVISLLSSSLAPTKPVAVPVAVAEYESEDDCESDSDDDDRMFTKGGDQLLASLDQRPFRKSINFKTDYYNGFTDERTIAITKAMKTYMAARETFTPWSVADAVRTSFLANCDITMPDIRNYMGKIVCDGEII